MLLTILIVFYQEHGGVQQQAKTNAFQERQAQQIQHLTLLVEKLLLQAAERPEERFVVRERSAAVRSKPEHGAAVEGRLLPNEVVRAVDRKGYWVEVEYYHWLHEEYRTGWVLKKYLERVPMNYTVGGEPQQ